MSKKTAEETKAFKIHRRIIKMASISMAYTTAFTLIDVCKPKNRQVQCQSCAAALAWCIIYVCKNAD
jgi:uncharacterized membrane protein YjjB (DUF3815 family)